MPVLLLFACALAASVGCKTPAATTGAAPTPAAPVNTAKAPAVPAGELGSISGTVLFAGKPPAPVRIDTSMDPACSLGGEPDVFSEQYVVAGGKLANVFVTLKSGPDEAMHPERYAETQRTQRTVVLDQKGCRYTPHVVALGAGDLLEFRNSDPTMHNIHTIPSTVGNDPVDVSQSPRGAPIRKQFAKPETMLPVRCNNHPWMNAFINVAATPSFAVSDAGGHFDLRGLPPGDYVLTAVHEKLGEQTATVTVPKSGAAKATFTFASR